MTPAFARNGLTALLYGVTVGSWLVSELTRVLRRRPTGARHDRGTFWLVDLGIGAAWGLTALATSRLPGAAIGDGEVSFALGVVVAWSGLGLRWWAFRALGTYFTVRVTIVPGQSVVTSGPYRVLRHPSYTGLMLILFGIGLMWGNWVGLAAMVVLPLSVLVLRIRVEERALNAELGAAYQEFAATRKRMIPFVW